MNDRSAFTSNFARPQPCYPHFLDPNLHQDLQIHFSYPQAEKSLATYSPATFKFGGDIPYRGILKTAPSSVTTKTPPLGAPSGR